jgi:hypothetical protein
MNIPYNSPHYKNLYSIIFFNKNLFSLCFLILPFERLLKMKKRKYDSNNYFKEKLINFIIEIFTLISIIHSTSLCILDLNKSVVYRSDRYLVSVLI